MKSIVSNSNIRRRRIKNEYNSERNKEKRKKKKERKKETKKERKKELIFVAGYSQEVYYSIRRQENGGPE